MKLYALIFDQRVDVEALKKDGYIVIDMTDRCPEGFYYMEVSYYSEDGDLDMAVPKYLKLSNINRWHDSIMDLESGVISVEYNEELRSKLYRVGKKGDDDESVGRIANRPIVMLIAVAPHGMVIRTCTEHAKGILASGTIDHISISREMEDTLDKATVALIPEEAAAFRTVH